MAETRLDGLTGVGLSEAEYVIVETPRSGVTFVGKARDQSTSTSAPEWQISRTIVSGATSTTQFALQGAYRSIWDDRELLFPGGVSGVFANTKSIFFDGINDRLTYGNLSAVSFAATQPFTMSLWTKHNGVKDSVFAGKKAGINNDGYNLRISPGDNLEFRITGTGGFLAVRVPDVPSQTAGVWTHFVVTYDGSLNASGVNIYVNGAPRATSTFSDTLSGSSINSDNFAIGSRSGGGGELQGNVDEVALWNVELSAADVLEVYNFGSPNNLQDVSTASDLVFWSRMGDGLNDTFPTIFDQVGGAGGTMINMMAGNIENDVPNS